MALDKPAPCGTITLVLFRAPEIIIKKPAFRRALPSPLGGVLNHPCGFHQESAVLGILGQVRFPFRVGVGADDPFLVVRIVEQHRLHRLHGCGCIGRADHDVIVATLCLPVRRGSIAVVLHVLGTNDDGRGALSGRERRVGGGVHARIVADDAILSTPPYTHINITAPSPIIPYDASVSNSR